ncbi:hypothetical protein ACVWWH_000001, partial [Sinomonas sp. RB5]
MPETEPTTEVADHREDHGHAHAADHVIHAEDAGYHKG